MREQGSPKRAFSLGEAIAQRQEGTSMSLSGRLKRQEGIS